MERALELNGKIINQSGEVYFIAEIGSNHNGDMDLCRRLIDAAEDAGADAVKFQSWSDKSLISRSEYEKNTSYTDKKRHFGTLKEMVTRYQLTPDQHRDICEYCNDKNISFCSTPFSCEEVDMLDELNVPFFKIASMDVIHLPLLRHIARKGKPVILSTGMASLSEIERAVNTIFTEGNRQLALLHCVALYPPEDKAVNLRNIKLLSDIFQIPVGYSDHTIGITASLTSIALGARIVEKHFTLDKNMDGWDHWISSDPFELKTLITEGKRVNRLLGSYPRLVSEAEIEKAKAFRRSIVARHSLKKGHRITERDLDFKRPGTGIKPDEADYIIGRTLVKDIEYDDMFTWDHLN